jgi:hypothetical protein
MTFKNVAEFDFQSAGDITGEQYLGHFTIKLHLSVAEQLAVGRRKKELLPKDWLLNPEDITSVQMDNQAELLSLLPIRIIGAPDWWGASKFGQDIVDENILFDLYKKVMEILSKDAQERQAKAKDAATALGKVTL